MGEDIWGKPLLILGLITLLGGIQLITIGILAEVSIRTYYESSLKKTYQVRRVWTEEVREPEASGKIQEASNKLQDENVKQQEIKDIRQDGRSKEHEAGIKEQETRIKEHEAKIKEQDTNRNKQLKLPLLPKTED
jgi:hypothetical protein